MTCDIISVMSMKNAIYDLKENIEQHSIKDSPLLKTILTIFRRVPPENSDLDFIPGFSYAFIPDGVDQNDMDVLFHTVISSDQLVEKNEDIASLIIAHIAAFNFGYFVDNLASILLSQENLSKKFLATRVARHILDPVTGFLRNSPFSPFNDAWNDPSHVFNFFAEDSEDRQTPFGVALDKFRWMVHEEINKIMILEDYVNKGVPNQSIFVPSMIVSVQSTVIPPSYRMVDISCGFPARTEVMLTISKFQEQTSHNKTRDLEFEISETAKEWSNAFTGLFQTKQEKNEKNIHLYESDNTNRNIIMRFAKLLLYLNMGVSVQVPEEKFKYAMKLILCNDLEMASFSLQFSQALLFVYPEFSFTLFDDILGIIEYTYTLSIHQKFTFLLSISRFVDVLSLLPTRYIDDQQIEILTSLSLIGICSTYVEIRYISFKLTRSLGNFEANTDSLNLYQFIMNNSNNFERFLFNAYENNPQAILLNANLHVLSPLRFKEAMVCRDQMVWQNTISAMGILISQQFPETFTRLLKKLCFDNMMSNQINTYVLTFLSSLADTPLTSTPEDKASLEITKKILTEMIKITKIQMDDPNSSNALLYVMINPLHISTFSLMIDMLNQDANANSKSISIFLLAMSWNINFNTITSDNEFFGKFIDLFLQVVDSFSDKELMSSTLETFNENQIQLVNTENQFLCNILSCLHQILSSLYSHFSFHFEAPFPCMNFVIDTEVPLIKKTQRLFPFIYNLVNLSEQLKHLSNTPQKHQYQQQSKTRSKGQTNDTFNKPMSELHCFAIKALEMWLACNTLTDISFLCTETFLEKLPSLAYETPHILLHLLTHHFEVLFSLFLDYSLQPGGESFFSAIAAFFKAPSLSADIMPIDSIKTQWGSCDTIYSTLSVSKYLQTLYENCGTFILCCLTYMVIPNTELNNKAFITLSSIIPVILLFHTKGRVDAVSPIIETISSICEQAAGQSLSFFDVQTIVHLSESICEHFQFCMEQLLYNMCCDLPTYDTLIIDRVLIILMPWFSQIQFDIENRVISKETDLLFIRFSCFSFVETLMSAFAEIANDDINSSLFNVWRTVATEDGVPGSNFLYIVLSVLYLVSSPRYHHAAFIIIRYMYRISPQTIIDILSSYLSFSFNANSSYLESPPEEQENGDIKEFLNGGAQEDEDNLLNNKKANSTIIDFILKMLDQLAHESVRPLVSSLPLIFSYCIVSLDLHFEAIQALMTSILTELKPYLENTAIPYLQEVLRLILSLPSIYPSVSNLHGEKLYVAEQQLSQKLPYADRSEITRAITNFFQNLSENIAAEFGLEIIKWGLCSSDLYRGSFAMACYRGNLLQANNLLVGLIARSMWYCFDAVEFLYTNTDRSNITVYSRYIAECFKTLHSIAAIQMDAGTIGASPTFLWMAIEGTKCNAFCLAPIFDSALALLEYLLYPTLFSYINGKAEYSTMYYTPHMFTKYHSPWGDAFYGCAQAIFEYHGPNPDIFRMIRVINYLVQSCYPLIFSESENWAYVALLSLIPWLWSVIITDISRFFFSSPSVHMMEATIEALGSFINDEPIVIFFQMMMSDEEMDVFTIIANVCKLIVPIISTEELILIANFFTNILMYGNKSFKMPLYSVVTHILNYAQDKEAVAAAFTPFTDIVKRDYKITRATYVKMCLSAFEKAVGENPIDPNLIFNKNDPQELPPYPIFERIVAVDIPHLYDFTSTEAQSITFQEINSFPPICPEDLNLYSCPKFQQLKGILRYVKCEPFFTWTDLINRLHTSLIETEDVEIMQRFELSCQLDISKVLLDVVANIEKDEKLIEEQEEQLLQQQLMMQQQQMMQEESYEQAFMEDDPFSFIFMKADMFVPTVDEANYVGMELFGDDVTYS
ncbi:hypothetical protein TRFO_28113 [Tritrichomonas foetus]|uniref:Uncharacterized protein n=1 Tax=Tritrichomonas foetus TaxID=1144522 RepID=A0A1J4K3N2_9EUKA|nr:hypothetical protein TRFO_28113 [Tritrichomonas foetus]|eukprot:OHT04356.1 hypothetical protein TRFO_28113 [Tritrichomonas foetus]